MSRKDVNRKEIAATCLDILGAAYRSDWSGVDGRQTKVELEDISALLRKDKTFTVDEYIERVGIISTEHGWEWEY